MRYLLDTNVLLNGLFNPLAHSRKVLEKVHDGALQACISRYIELEARERIERLRSSTTQDLSPILDGFLGLGVLPVVDDVGNLDDPRLKIINRKDRAVVATALCAGYAICTNDIEDYRKVADLGLKVITSFDLGRDGAIGLHTVFRFFPLNSSHGAVYIKFHPQWTGVRFSADTNERFCIFDQVGLGNLSYIASKSSFVFEGEGVPSVSLEVKEIPAVTSLVFSYSDTEGVSIYFGLNGLSESAKGTWDGTKARMGRLFPTHDRHGNNQLFGCIPVMTSFPSNLTAKAARKLLKEVVVPDAEERFSLEDVVSRFYT